MTPNNMINEALYATYLQALLAGDRSQCAAIVQDLLKHGIAVKNLYMELFQRAMYEVGALWELNKISVASEHLATSVTESLLTLVYPQIFAAEHIGKKAIISCVANEYHQIGGKMAADILELHGWDAFFLGANTPMDALLMMIDDKQPDVLGLSLSIYANMPNLYAVLDSIRAKFAHLPVLVGGQAFRWGGADIGTRYTNLTLIESLEHLQQYLQDF